MCSNQKVTLARSRKVLPAQALDLGKVRGDLIRTARAAQDPLAFSAIGGSRECSSDPGSRQGSHPGAISGRVEFSDLQSDQVPLLWPVGRFNQE